MGPRAGSHSTSAARRHRQRPCAFRYPLDRGRRSPLLARRFLRWALGRRDGGDDLDRMPREWHARIAGADGAAIVGELAAGTGEHLDAALLRRIDVPTQVLRGDRSQPAFAAAAGRVAGTVRGAVLVDVIRSGHAVQLDAAQRVADGVTALRAGATLRPPAR
jgi:pimeloyl-ACP methyl ester carboxylesterase